MQNVYRRPYWNHSDPTAAAPTIACPGEHNDDARRGGTESEPRLVYGDPVWCERCSSKLASTLRYLPQGATALEIEIEEATDTAPERVSGTRSRPLHEHQAQAMLIDEIRDILGQLEDEVREWRGLTPRRRAGVRQHTAIANSSKFLLAHQDWLLTKAPQTDEPDGLVRVFVDRLRSLDRRAMRLTHQQEPKAEDCVGVPCRECNMKNLVRSIDRRSGAPLGEIQCENCGYRMSPSEYEPWAKQWGIHTYATLDDETRAEHQHAVAAYERTRAAA